MPKYMHLVFRSKSPLILVTQAHLKLDGCENIRWHAGYLLRNLYVELAWILYRRLTWCHRRTRGWIHLHMGWRPLSTWRSAELLKRLCRSRMRRSHLGWIADLLRPRWKHGTPRMVHLRRWTQLGHRTRLLLSRHGWSLWRVRHGRRRKRRTVGATMLWDHLSLTWTLRARMRKILRWPTGM